MTTPLLLSVDTATSRGVVALSRGDVLLSSATYSAGSDHAEKLLDHVRVVLEAAGFRLEQIERYGVGVGPGSFTGVRVGVATIKAFAIAFPRPVAAVSTLALLVEASAGAHPGTAGEAVGGLVAAGREDAFVGIFGPGTSRDRAIGPRHVEVVSHALLPSFFASRALASAVGADAGRLLPHVTDRTTNGGLPTAAALARLASLAPIAVGDAVSELEPAYMRPPQITASRARSPAR